MRLSLLLASSFIGMLGVCGAQSEASATKRAFVVAVDIGHTPSTGGATSATGTSEFEVNQALGRLLLRSLARCGFEGSFLVNENDQEIDLCRRTRVATERGAAILVSLHHDSVQPQYLERRRIGGREQTYSERYRGFSLFYSERGARPKESLRLGELIGRELVSEGLRPSLHHAEPIAGENRTLVAPKLGLYRFDELVVLKTAQIPTILIESGVIVHPEEERRLRNRAYRVRIASRIARGIDAFYTEAQTDKALEKRRDGC